jgi:hypothetical protein
MENFLASSPGLGQRGLQGRERDGSSGRLLEKLSARHVLVGIGRMNGVRRALEDGCVVRHGSSSFSERESGCWADESQAREIHSSWACVERSLGRVSKEDAATVFRARLMEQPPETR